MSNGAESTPQSSKKKRKITIDIPKSLEAVYGNIAFINHTPAEVVVDFAQVLPRMPRGSIVARVIMTPMHAKLLQMALAQNIANYERQFGEIRIPRQASPLADSFFRFTQRGPGDDQDNDDENE